MSDALDRISRLAPDQASLTAAQKLMTPSHWVNLGEDGRGLVWGECQGSGATPYRVCLSESDAGYKCSCPSRKFPCKHCLALMGFRALGTIPFTVDPAIPLWAQEWLSRRRGAARTQDRKQKGQEENASGAKAGFSVPDAEAGNERPAAASLLKTHAQRERNKLKREALFTEGVECMEQWLSDQIDQGLAGFDQRARTACVTLAKRLYDAKAPGLANRVSALPDMLLSVDSHDRPFEAARCFAALLLLGRTCLRSDTLPAALVADARRVSGWVMTREELLSESSALKRSGSWRVLGIKETVQPDRMKRIETWLGLENEPTVFALLVDYIVPGSQAGSLPFLVDDTMDAECVYYPSPVPLRVQIASSHGTEQASAPWSCRPRSLATALNDWRHALAAKPWLGDFPLAVSPVFLRSSGDSLFLVEDDIVLPVVQNCVDSARCLCRVGPVGLFGLWNGRVFTPLLASTSLGIWRL